MCKKKAGFTCDEIECDSDRVMGVDVSYNGCNVLTVYGVYIYTTKIDGVVCPPNIS